MLMATVIMIQQFSIYYTLQDQIANSAQSRKQEQRGKTAEGRA